VPSTASAGVGVVVIGRNEADRLVLCLRSVLREVAVDDVVYVDSGSTDDSVARARELGVVALELDRSRPFSAARGRNEGAAWFGPERAMIQFIDGDCELAVGWLAHGAHHLDANPEVAALCGHLREREPQRNAYHRLAALEWVRTPGPITGPYGIVMVRASAFNAVGGYAEDLIAGEDPELGLRLGRAGHRLLHLDHEMAVHDIAMQHAWQWWQRSLRSGYAYAQGAWRHRAEGEGYRVREVASIVAWSLGPVLAALAGLPVLLLAYGVLWYRVYARVARRATARDASLCATSTVLAKFPQVVGVARFAWRGILLGRASDPIEHKG